MAQPHLRLDIADGVARITLDRAKRHNAFDDALVKELADALARVSDDDAVRVVVLAAKGPSFSAGADLDWMRRMADYSPEENLADARALAAMLCRLDQLPKPTIALVQGGAYGGGAGLVAACDIAIAGEAATFAFTEVRLGLIPSVISPYVIAAIGRRAARRLLLTAEKIDAAEAHRLGLVHAVVPADALEETIAEIIDHLRRAGPSALSQAKRLIADVADSPIDDALIEETARRIARARATEEAREGIAAFLERRRPSWSAD